MFDCLPLPSLSSFQGLKTDASIAKNEAEREAEAAKAAGKPSAAYVARYKANVVALLAERMVDYLERKLNAASIALDKATYAADAALGSWNDASNGGLAAQAYAAKLAIASVKVTLDLADLQYKVNQARALGLLPVPLSAVESRAARRVPARFNADGTGASVPSTGAGRRRRQLLATMAAEATGGAAPARAGRSLLQAAPETLDTLVGTLDAQPLAMCAPGQVSQDAALRTVRGYLADVPMQTVGGVVQPPLTDGEYTSIARAYLFPCTPVINFEDVSANLPNVQTAMSVLKKDLWLQSTEAKYRRNGPPPDGYDPAGASGPMKPGEQLNSDTLYQRLLEFIGRYPFLCGEPLEWSGGTLSVEEGCKREIAAFMANAAQEVGWGVKDADEWKAFGMTGPYRPMAQQAFAFSRESGFYTLCAQQNANCTKYDPWSASIPTTTVESCGAGLGCYDGTQHYYGRGWHQVG